MAGVICLPSFFLDSNADNKIKLGLSFYYTFSVILFFNFETVGIYRTHLKNIWFDCERLFMRSEDGNVYSRPLEAFPELLEASAEQRNDYKIDEDGEAIR